MAGSTTLTVTAVCSASYSESSSETRSTTQDFPLSVTPTGGFAGVSSVVVSLLSNGDRKEKLQPIPLLYLP